MMHPLNSKEKRSLLKQMDDQWGFKGRLSSLYMNKEGRIYESTAEPLDGLRIETAGNYIAKQQIDGLSLSIEGSQLIGPTATKNVVEIDAISAKAWMNGQDIEGQGQGYVIIRYQDDFLGSGKASDGKILNRIPKIRRLSTTEMII
ncbi:MAG: hypothetical protein KJ709_02085 [Nanoarchaeota archaeon]|nr:hypothetical protein [Nanoarchaeota archaeon]